MQKCHSFYQPWDDYLRLTGGGEVFVIQFTSYPRKSCPYLFLRKIESNSVYDLIHLNLENLINKPRINKKKKQKILSRWMSRL